MKLKRHDERGWTFQLEPQEYACLVYLLEGFPFASGPAPSVSKTDTSPQAGERQALLEEFLRDHRRDLEKQARALADEGKWTMTKRRAEIHLDAAEREALVQILNDIRVSGWHALGQPDPIEEPPIAATPEQIQHHSLMQLASFFEYHLIESVLDEGPPT